MSRTTEKFMVLDVETANTLKDALTYDIGLIVADRQGTIYKKKSFVVYDVFCGYKDLMQSAYYHEKIPAYEKKLSQNEVQMVQFKTARNIVYNLIQNYNIKNVYAYNALFDLTALNTTQRYLTKSLYRYFFPYGTEIRCIWHMACQTICNRMNYCKFCADNGYYSKAKNMTTNAETVYRFLHNDTEFAEMHQGLDDVMIEYEILLKCLTYHEKINRQPNRGCYHIPQKKFKKVLKKHLTKA